MVDCGVSSCDNFRPFCGESDVRSGFGAGDSRWLEDPLTGLVYVPSLITGLETGEARSAGESDDLDENWMRQKRGGVGGVAWL